MPIMALLVVLKVAHYVINAWQTICKSDWRSIKQRRNIFPNYYHIPCYKCGKYRRTFLDMEGVRICKGCHLKEDGP